MANGVPVTATNPIEARLWQALLADLVTRLKGVASQALQITGALTVGGNAVVTGNASVGGTTTLGGAVTTVSSVTVGGAIIASTSATIGGALDHDGSTVGFYGAAPVARATVTGSRGGNAALASLLTALAGCGLIVDSTTA